MKKKYEFSSNKRILVVTSCFFLVFVLIFYKLVEIQVLKGMQYRIGALDLTTKNISLSSERGEIFDRTGKKMAVNKKGFTLWVHRKEIEEEDIENFSERVAEVLGKDAVQISERIKAASGNFKLEQWIEKDMAEQLQELKLKGLQVEEGMRRYYPYEKTGAFFVGFTDIDHQGIEGIEKYYNEQLTGSTGRIVRTMDGLNNKVPFYGERSYNSNDGLQAIMTIDVDLQRMCEQAAKKALVEDSAKETHIIAMEPKTGKILAMASMPDYDLNSPRDPRNEEERSVWENLNGEELSEKWFDMWRNRAISNVYEPGSTFKAITTAIALEENIAKENTTYICNGIFKEIKGQALKCVDYPKTHGRLTVQKGLDVSCNVLFIKLGLSIGRDILYRYIQAFGFGEKTGIDLGGEGEGILPNKENLRDIGVATLSYGHGISVTPLQMITAAAVLVNGGNLMQPYIVDRFVDQRGEVIYSNEPIVRRRVLSEKTSERMIRLLRSVITEGTGKKLNIQGYSVIGKTGTSIKIENRKYNHDLTVASMFAAVPAEDPKVIFLGIVDEPKTTYRTGGVVAGKMLREVMDHALPYLNIPRSEPISVLGKTHEKTELMNLVGMNAIEAGKMLEEKNIPFTLKYEDDTNTDYVIAQSVAPGVVLPEGEKVTLTLGGENERVMPTFVGMDKKTVVTILDKLEINYEISGKGVVVNQEPQAGSLIDEKTKIKIELSTE